VSLSFVSHGVSLAREVGIRERSERIIDGHRV
jgi:hypothetical protein